MPEWGIQIENGWFDESRHVYRDEAGVIVPSTTQVFAILGLVDYEGVPEELLKWKSNYSVAVHKAIEFLVVKDLDWDTLDEAIVPAVTGLEQFLKKIGYEHEAAEEKKIGNLFGMKYGLMVDLRGSIMHQGKRRSAIIDLKGCVKYSPTFKWQIGGYTSSQPKAEGGWMGVVAQFSKEGEVVPHYVDIIPAQREFQILLSAANLKLNAGLAKIGKAA